MRAKIPHPLWATHLRSFSDVHRGWLVRLDGLDGGPGELPLAGIDVMQRGIVVRLGRGQGSLTYVVGDPIAVRRADRSVAHFEVTKVASYLKRAFPSDEVYGPTLGPALRLITCGGSFDRERGSYRSNIVVYATATP